MRLANWRRVGVAGMSGLSKAQYREQMLIHHRDIALTVSRLVVLLERVMESRQYRD